MKRNQFIKEMEQIQWWVWIPTPLRKEENIDIIRETSQLFPKWEHKGEIEYLYTQLTHSNSINRENATRMIEELQKQEKIYPNEETEIKEISKAQIIEKVTIQKYEYLYREIELLLLLHPTDEEVLHIVNFLEKESAHISNERLIGYIWNFLSYSINNDKRELFNELLVKYIKNHTDKYWLLYVISDVNWFAYIVENKESISLLFKNLEKNLSAFKSFISFWYERENREEYNQLIKKIESKIIQDTIKNILTNNIWKWYQENFREVVTSDFFWYLLYTQSTDNSFSEPILKQTLDTDSRLRDEKIQIIINLINDTNVDFFLKSITWDIFYLIDGVYQKLKNTKKETADKLYLHYKKQFEESEKNREKNIKQQKETKKERNASIKQRIKAGISHTTSLEKESWKSYFDEVILHNFERYEDLFSETQKEVVKSQIDLFLSSPYTDPSDEKAKVALQEENKFTRPSYIQSLTLAVELSPRVWIDLTKYRKRIISLMPYVFSSQWKFWEVIKESDITISDTKDIDRILSIYKDWLYWDLRFLHPTKILELIQEKILNIDIFTEDQSKVLSLIIQEFITSTNNRIDQYRKKQYVDFLIENTHIDCKWTAEEYKKLSKLNIIEYNYFDDYLRGNIPEEEREQYEYFLQLNELIIYRHPKEGSSINRRFRQLLETENDIPLNKRSWVYSPNSIESELWLGWRFDKPFYQPIIDKVVYPKCKEKFNEILHKANSIIQEDSSIKPYLYRFASKYYKNTPEDKREYIYQEIRDSNFILQYLDGAERDQNQRSQYNMSLLFDENQDLKRENEKLKKELTIHSRLKLYVEWKIDKEYIQRAYYQLNQSLPDFEIIVVWWALNVWNMASHLIDEGIWWIHIGLLDRDEKGMTTRLASDHKNKTDKHKSRKQNICQNKKIFENHNKSRKWYYSFIFLPRTDQFYNQIFSPVEEMQAKNSKSTRIANGQESKLFLKKEWIIYWEWYNPLFTIEHLLYCETTKSYFKDVTTPWSWKIVTIDSKKKLSDNVSTIPIPISVRENFKPLFDYLQTIQKDFNKQNK